MHHASMSACMNAHASLIEMRAHASVCVCTLNANTIMTPPPTHAQACARIRWHTHLLTRKRMSVCISNATRTMNHNIDIHNRYLAVHALHKQSSGGYDEVRSVTCVRACLLATWTHTRRCTAA